MSFFHSSRQFVPRAAQESHDGTVGVLRGAEQEHSVAEKDASVARHVRVRKHFIMNLQGSPSGHGLSDVDIEFEVALDH